MSSHPQPRRGRRVVTRRARLAARRPQRHPANLDLSKQLFDNFRNIYLHVDFRIIPSQSSNSAKVCRAL